jgi:hypothetical protein
MEINKCSFGPELCFDVLVEIFKVLRADEHKELIRLNLSKTLIHVLPNALTALSQVSKLWLQASRAAGLMGYYIDFPSHKVLLDNLPTPPISLKILNKYGIIISLNSDNTIRYLYIHVPGITGNESVYIGIQYQIGVGYNVHWGKLCASALSMNDRITICRRLRGLFGNESPIAKFLMNEESSTAIVRFSVRNEKARTLEKELLEWTKTLIVAGAFVI